MGKVGSDLALETADAVVVRDEFSTNPAVLALSRSAHRLVVQNLVIAGARRQRVFAAELLAEGSLCCGSATRNESDSQFDPALSKMARLTKRGNIAWDRRLAKPAIPRIIDSPPPRPTRTSKGIVPTTAEQP